MHAALRWSIWLLSACTALAACTPIEPTLVVDVSTVPPSSTELRVLVHLDQAAAEQPVSFPLNDLAQRDAINLGLRLPARAAGAQLAVGVAAIDGAGRIIAVGSQLDDPLRVQGGSQGEQHVRIELIAVAPRLAAKGPLLLHADPPLLSTDGRNSAGDLHPLRILGWELTPNTQVWISGRPTSGSRWTSGVELFVDAAMQQDRLGAVLIELGERGSRTDRRGDLFSYFAAQIDFVSEHSFHGVDEGISFISSGDFNEDGHLDLIIRYINDLSVWLGDGHGSFASMLNAPRIENGGMYSPQLLAVGDATGDGHLDAFVVCKTDLCLLRGTGTGIFETPQILAAAVQPDFVWVADVNGDHVPDVVLHDPAARRVAFLFGQGQGRFSELQHSPQGAQLPPTDVMAVADVNHDGEPDLVLGEYLDGPSFLSLYPATGRGGFYEGESRYLGFSIDPFRVAVDLSSADGRTDIFVTSANELRVLSFKQGIWFDQESSHAVLGPLTALDVNGDRRIDVLAENPCNASLLLNQGNGVLRATDKVPRCLSDRGKLHGVGDFDEDGLLDLIVGDDTISILPGQQDGSYHAAAEYTASAETSKASRMLVADFAHRGVPNVYTFGDNAAQVLENRGDGTLREPRPLHDIVPGSYAFVADFNADGELDLSFVSTQRQEAEIAAVLKIYLGNGNGSFGSAIQSTCMLGTLPAIRVGVDRAFVAELTGDRWPDLAIKETTGIRVLRGQGDGRFESGATIDFGYALTDAIAADVNGDRRLEIIGISESLEVVTIKSIGKLSESAARAEHQVFIRPRLVMAEDWNGDRNTDLFLAEDGTRTALLRGDGAGNFHAPILGAAAQSVSARAIGDFNGDGLLDIATSGFGPNLILRNRGGGVFEPSSHGKSSRCAFQVADLNRDLHPDLLCLYNNHVRVLLNVSQ